MSDLDAQFETAALEVKTIKKQPDNETLLELYSLYKQASTGDASGKRPGFTDPVGRAKYDAWLKKKGMSSDAAKQAYIDLVNRLLKK